MTTINECDILLLLLLGCIGVSIGILPQLSSCYKEDLSNCQSCFLHGLDRYIYNGTLDTTFEDLSRRRFALFQMRSLSSNVFTTVCTVTLYPSCDNRQCYCKTSSGSKLELILNQTADIQYSNGTVRISWPKLNSADDSDEKQVPVIYTEPVKTLIVNHQNVILKNLEKCDFQLSTGTKHHIEWCVGGLSTHNLTLEISSTKTTTTNECINVTYELRETENSSINFSVSYLELEYCKRNETIVCYLDNNIDASATTLSTLNTTTDNIDASATTLSTLNTTTGTGESSSSKPISKGLAGVLSAHVVVTVAVIVVSSIVIFIILERVKMKQEHINGRPKYLYLLCILVALSEIAQIILVIAAAKIFDQSQTFFELWKIMIIYQLLISILFIVVESILLWIKTSSKEIQIGSQAFIYLTSLISIHTGIGIIAVPLLCHFLGNFHLQAKEICPSVEEKSDLHLDRVHNKVTKKAQDEEDSNNKMIAQFSVKENTDVTDQAQQRKGKNHSKKFKRQHSKEQIDSKEIENIGANVTRIGTASEISIVLDEKNSSINSKDNVLREHKIKDKINSNKRPTSIEVTSHHELVKFRKLPPLEK